MKILALNCGSSSLKFRLVGVPQEGGDQAVLRMVIGGEVKGIGGRSSLRLTIGDAAPQQSQGVVRHHQQAVQWAFEQLAGQTIDAVGHRVVHGGESFVESVRIDTHVLAQIEQLTELAPLHNPLSVIGIREARRLLGDQVPMVAVFDTAFHRSMPAYASTYAIPHVLADHHRIRRYGFHGIAHASVVARYAAFTGRALEHVRLITLHLGHGCSAAAIRNGRSIDTSMGFTPLEGLVMGTRSGDVDPAIMSYLGRRQGIQPDNVERMLNEQSGLRGLSGLSDDMAVLLEAERQNHPRAKMALEVFCYRVRKYLGAYLVALGGADAVIFSGGIGEHAPEIRGRICQDMEWCGLRLDPERNAAAVGLKDGDIVCLSPDGIGMAAYVVAVDEETEIARETVRCLKA